MTPYVSQNISVLLLIAFSVIGLWLLLRFHIQVLRDHRTMAFICWAMEVIIGPSILSGPLHGSDSLLMSGQDHGTPMDSYRVLSQTEQGPDDVTLVEQHQYIDGRVRENDVTFHRDDSGGWRQVLPPEMVPKLGVVINDLAGATTASAAPVPGAPPGGK